MFERYTETARKVIFFGRHAASQFGGEYIDTEHLLLGVLRADPPLAQRVFKSNETIALVREQIEKQFPPREKVSTSADLPLSHQSKRVLAFAAEQAGRLNHPHISSGHLLLGLLLGHECTASKILLENGITFPQLEEAAKDAALNDARDSARTEPKPVLVPPIAARTASHEPVIESHRDLTAAANDGTLNPLIGRERELDSIIRILSRRTRCNPVLIGEPGVGKDAIVHGLAQRIADGDVPASLAGRSVMAMDAGGLLSIAQKGRLPDFAGYSNAILYVHGLFDLAGKSALWGVLEAIHVLEPSLAREGLQCIATGTPLGYRTTAEKAAPLARHFEVVPVLPPGEEETIQIVRGVKPQYEKFHGVVITDEAIETAVSASRWFLRHLQLPDRVIDLIDEAGATVNVRCEKEPREIAEIRKRLRVIVRDMEKAIALHEFEKARAFSAEERTERQRLERVRAEVQQAPSSNVVNAEDIVEAVAGRAGATMAVVKSVMQVKSTTHLELIANELAAQIPLGGREWAEALVAYLASCSPEDAEKVTAAINAAKAKLDAQ